jgi:hypothetical protein
LLGLRRPAPRLQEHPQAVEGRAEAEFPVMGRAFGRQIYGLTEADTATS